VVKLLFKKRDREKVKNYKLIILLNINYKIFMKVLTKRLNLVLNKILKLQQNGFIKTKSIFNNIIEIRVILKKIKEKNVKKGGFLLLDFEKAYNRMNREFIWKMMNKMGFDEKFINILEKIHKNSMIKVEINSFLFKKFKVRLGVKQSII
jgi:hypothetical protein